MLPTIRERRQLVDGLACPVLPTDESTLADDEGLQAAGGSGCHRKHLTPFVTLTSDATIPASGSAGSSWRLAGTTNPAMRPFSLFTDQNCERGSCHAADLTYLSSWKQDDVRDVGASLAMWASIAQRQYSIKAGYRCRGDRARSR